MVPTESIQLPNSFARNTATAGGQSHSYGRTIGFFLPPHLSAQRPVGHELTRNSEFPLRVNVRRQTLRFNDILISMSSNNYLQFVIRQPWRLVDAYPSTSTSITEIPEGPIWSVQRHGDEEGEAPMVELLGPRLRHPHGQGHLGPVVRRSDDQFQTKVAVLTQTKRLMGIRAFFFPCEDWV